MLNRELDCRLSFLTTGPCMDPAFNLVLLRGVGGGAVPIVFVFAYKKDDTVVCHTQFKNKNK